MQANSILKDPRYFQILFQCTFLLFGTFFLHWLDDVWLFAVYLFSCISSHVLAELVFRNKAGRLFQRIQRGFPSVAITALGLCLLLKTESIWVAVLASASAIFSKYIFYTAGRHIFNPSAFGIVVAVYTTGAAWVSPGQWGNSAILVFSILCFGFIITTRIQKMDLSLVYLLVFSILLFARQILYLGWPLDYFVQSITTGSLLLFSFFMISDPKTIPENFWARIIWSAAIAATSFYLVAFQYVSGAPIIVLILAQPLVPLLNKIFVGRRFEWQPTTIAVSSPGLLFTSSLLPFIKK